MLAIDPVSTLDDYYIHVRDSMIKFESNDWDLEICDYARPSNHYYLHIFESHSFI